MGDVGHKFPAHLLVLPLLGDIVEHHKGAPSLPAPVEGGHEQLEEAVTHLALLLQVVGGSQHLVQGGRAAEQLLIGGLPADGPAEQPVGGGVGVDDPALPGEGHHTVGHVEEQGVQLVALVLHLAQGVLELAGHVVEGVGKHADLVLGGHLDFF